MSHAYDLREQIQNLESIKGEGTELITLTVPADKSLHSVRTRIRNEHASAEHIKSDRTRNRVQQALNRVQRILQGYDTTPANGLIIYAGVVDGELISHVFDDLQNPLVNSTYICDNQFDLSELRAAAQPADTYGLIVVERGGAVIGRLIGDRIIPVQVLESQVMGKTRAGGQSAQRFKRERKRQKHEFFQEVAAIATESLVAADDTVSGLVIGGTLATVKEFRDGGYLDHRLQATIVGTYPVEYGNRQGLEELVEKADSQILDAERRKERDVLDEFFKRLRDGSDVAYGSDEVEEALRYGAVETVIVSAAVSRPRRQDLEQLSRQQGGEACVVSAETEQGSQFAGTFDGVAALLRFPVK